MEQNLRRRFCWFLSSCICIFPTLTNAQLVADSLIVRFPSRGIEEVPFIVESVIDARGGAPEILAIAEVNRCLFVPVDRIVRTEQALCREIESMLTAGSRPGMPRFGLKIEEFRLARKPGLVYPHFALYASIVVKRLGPAGASGSPGRLLYEGTRRAGWFQGASREGYEGVMRDWRDRFVEDLTVLARDGGRDAGGYPFRWDAPPGRGLNLYGGLDITVAMSARIWDAQVFVSSREAGRSFFRSGGYHLRYRDEGDFDAIEFGLATDYWFCRLHRNWILRLKSQWMLGINRWDDIEKGQRELWDIVLADASFSQTVQFDPLNRASVLFGIGIMASVNYVYSKGLRFQPGLVLQAGWKL